MSSIHEIFQSLEMDQKLLASIGNRRQAKVVLGDGEKYSTTKGLAAFEEGLRAGEKGQLISDVQRLDADAEF